MGTRKTRRKRVSMDTNKLKLMAASYLRTAASSVAGAYLAGQTDPKTLLCMFIGALLGPLARALNPKDAAFGVGSK